jgi:hypothetical protein
MSLWSTMVVNINLTAPEAVGRQQSWLRDHEAIRRFGPCLVRANTGASRVSDDRLGSASGSFARSGDFLMVSHRPDTCATAMSGRGKGW